MDRFHLARSAGRWVRAVKEGATVLKAEYDAGRRGDDAPPEPEKDPELDTDAKDVAEALRRVDWAQVRADTARRSGDAARAMKAMADRVDWAKVQPAAAQVSSALIAAVASGRLPVGGRLTNTVARAIVDQGGLAQRVAANLDQPPPDFRQVIDTTASDAESN
ncbi:MAG TPA: hypothetical protein VGF22_22435 [Acidimicrobiales bacterium]